MKEPHDAAFHLLHLHIEYQSLIQKEWHGLAAFTRKYNSRSNGRRVIILNIDKVRVLETLAGVPVHLHSDNLLPPKELLRLGSNMAEVAVRFARGPS